MKLSLIVPCYNEEENIVPFFGEVCRVFGENEIQDYELIFVNDGSTDGTLTQLKNLYEENKKQVKVLSLSRNFGKEAAIYAGFEKSKGDLVCIIDADLQQRPEVVVEMLHHMESDETVDCVAACQKKRKESKLRTCLKSGFYKLINKISDVEFVNGASDFRLMKRQVVDAILEMKEYHRFSKGLFSYVGFQTKYIPYQVEQRKKGKSKWNTKSLFRYALEGIFSFSTMPLKVATFVGFFFSFCSLLYMCVVFVQKLAFGIAVPGYATIVSLILLIGGIQLFFLGVLGEYIARLFVQSKNRPIYILKECLENEETTGNP